MMHYTVLCLERRHDTKLIVIINIISISVQSATKYYISSRDHMLCL